ncbi:FecCD family ABC transporter permease [Streptomyces sp.]|uniref:FecCD family ABC transporter permease n=1 Tax=Streptomyces sp. TaxID=1931 RepID=UPI002F41561E
MTTMTAPVAAENPATPAGTDRRWAAPLLTVVVALAAAALLSLMIGGGRTLSPGVVWHALLGGTDAQTHATVHDIRLPRTLVALLVGASLGVAGALVQGVTRNPIVEPAVVGINSGAALAIAATTYVMGAATFQVAGLDLMPLVALAGAAAATGLVYAVVSGADMTPGRIALAGVTIAMLANSLVMSIVILNDAAVRFVLHYLVGGIDGVTWESVRTLAPYTVVGIAGALLLARSVTLLALGDDVARSLGVRVERIRRAVLGLIVLLAGAAVAVAGPIAMVGLIVPHIARWSLGNDYRRVLPFAAAVGALLLICADLVTRLLPSPVETPVGVLTALLGTPYFVYLARRGRGAV